MIRQERAWAFRALIRHAARFGSDLTRDFAVFLLWIVITTTACGDNVRLLPDAPVGTPFCADVPGCSGNDAGVMPVLCRRDGLCECHEPDGSAIECQVPVP